MPGRPRSQIAYQVNHPTECQEVESIAPGGLSVRCRIRCPLQAIKKSSGKRQNMKTGSFTPRELSQKPRYAVQQIASKLPLAISTTNSNLNPILNRMYLPPASPLLNILLSITPRLLDSYPPPPFVGHPLGMCSLLTFTPPVISGLVATPPLRCITDRYIYLRGLLGSAFKNRLG